ncbi:MAG: carbohydrate binding family 9 domain-containing protein [Microscillaceae bacterium]|jgi:hypothetical protein|nr:carbohydrate binding family 9 domain-containing protein [Microscillaceae bacterium]
MKIYYFFSFCFYLSFLNLFAQNAENFPPPTQPLRVEAIEIFEKIELDGKLNESSWQKAPIIDDFFRMEPRQGGNFLYKTQVKILFDKKNLYFGVFCQDSLGKKGVRVQDYRRDFIFGENDIFYLQLDPQNLKRYCMSFQTTPLGTQRDLQAFDDSFRDNDWDALWDVRTQVSDSGYTAEFVIPFKSLRYNKSSPSDSVSWGITLARLARRDYEQTVFPAIPQAFSPYRMTYAAQLQGLKLPPPSANIRIQPYALAEYQNNQSNGEKDQKFNSKFGGDIKWAVTPSAVLDLTFNTDFAQVEVDRAVNNLQRFNILFPERRQFFLENSGIWAGADIDGIKPFFSRRIGLDGDFNASPLGIDAGARFIDRNAKRSIAGLYVHQQAGVATGRSNFGVVRYLQNYGKQNNIGIMFTHRLDETRPEIGLRQRHNSSLSLDGFIRPKDEITIQYMVSTTRDNTSDSIGTAGSVFIGYTPNNMYWGNLSRWVSKNYNSTMGFVFQNDAINHNPGGYFIIRPKNPQWKWIRRYDPGFFLDYYHNASDGKFQQANLYIFPVYIIMQNGGFIEWAMFPTWQNINFDFRPLGIEIAQQNYYYFTQAVSLRSDASRKLSGSFRLDWGGYYNGKLTKLTLGSRFAPIPNIAFKMDYELNQFRRVGILNQNSDVHLFTGEVRLAYNPRILFSAFYQYNSFDNRGRWNLRASWQFTPLSFIYLVFNENQFLSTDNRNQSLISKVSFTKQF